MDKDLLGNDFTRNIDLSKIDKNLLMVKVVLILGNLYTIGEIWRELKLFLTDRSLYLAPANFYYFLLFILVTIPLAILFIISWFWYFKANRLMKLSIENHDAAIFNKAYAYINKSTVLSIVSSSLSLLSMLVSLALE